MESVLKTESTSNSLAISSGRSVDEDFSKGKNRNATLGIDLVWFDMYAISENQSITLILTRDF